MGDNLYHNLRKRMKVIESKVNEIDNAVSDCIISIESELEETVARLKAIEEHLTSLQLSSEGGNDPRDGGWFD